MTSMNFFLSLFFISPVAIFFYKQRGLGFDQVLMLESVLAFFIFIFEVPTGIFADKFGRKKSILAGIITFFVVTVMMIFARGFIPFAFIFAFTGIAVTFMTGSVEALIYDALKKRHKKHLMKKTMGNYGSASLTGKFIAPLVGGYIARELLPVDFKVLISLTLVCILMAFVLALTLKDSETKHVSERKPSSFVLLTQGINMLRVNKKLARIVFLSIFTSPFLFAFKYLSQEGFKCNGVTIVAVGGIFASSCLVSAVAQKYAYKFEDLIGMNKAVLFVTLLPGLLYLSLVGSPNPTWLIASFILIRASDGLAIPLFAEYRNIHIPSSNRATVISLTSMLACC